MIILDVETTGTDPNIHAICSMGAICYIEPRLRPKGIFPVIDKFYTPCRIPNGVCVDHEALAVNGFDPLSLVDPDKPTLERALWMLHDWQMKLPEQYRRKYGGGQLNFDRGMINRWASHFGVPIQIGADYEDLNSLCIVSHELRGKPIPFREANPGEVQRTRIKVDLIFNYVGLPMEPRPHHAFTGSKMETEAFERFLTGQKLFPEYREFPVPRYLPIPTDPNKIEEIIAGLSLKRNRDHP